MFVNFKKFNFYNGVQCQNYTQQQIEYLAIYSTSKRMQDHLKKIPSELKLSCLKENNILISSHH